MIQPAYESKRCTIYAADCLDVLPSLKPADLLVTDPPYGIGVAVGRSGYSGEGRTIRNDETVDVAVAGLAAVRLRNRRHAYVFWSPKVPRPSADALGLQEWVSLTWDKAGAGVGANHCWGLSHEQILFAVRGSKANRARGDGKAAARLRRGSVLRYPRKFGTATRRHPTEKPVPLLRELIESSSKPGETVLDPFAGVGSTLVAAILEGRKGVGIEIEPAYVEVAIRRVRAAEAVADQMDAA